MPKAESRDGFLGGVAPSGVMGKALAANAFLGTEMP